MIDLSGQWTLADTAGEHVLPMRLPGDVHSALFAAGRIADPYHGCNEYGLCWVADRDWTATRDFEVGQVGGRHLLVADGLDTVAEIRINDRLVLSAASAFREHVADVTDALLEGRNAIEIRFRSSTAEADRLQRAQPFPVPWHSGNCPIPNGNMLRKPQCDFGWDWNIALAPLGLHGRIGLIGPEGEITGVRITQHHHGGGQVLLGITARVRGTAARGAGWSVDIAGARSEGRVVPDGGKDGIGGGRFDAEIELDSPGLWWPNGYGPAVMNLLSIRIGALVWQQRVALRQVELVSEPDATGRSFGFRVNGRDIFARGANWIPADALPGRITPERTRDLLRSAAEANMNMLRVWGGGRYEPDAFYETCDELGLLVWQDFMFACHLYPATEDFLAEVGREVTYQARRIGHRVALWCGDNELLGALTWFEESRANRDRYLVAYDRLNRTIETTLKSALPEANWWPSSPSPGPMSFGDTWHDDSSGDMHFWSVWHEGRDFEHYRDVQPRFCSEFGFQSYASMPVIRSFADEADLNIASPVMESHQKNAGGNARIAETMFRYFRFPKDFESFVWLSQIQQGVAIRTAVEYWRSLKPHCMGALYWQLNDTWPVASWSGLDYGGGWKLLHHLARRFFQPVAVAAIPEARGGFRISAVNDTAEPVGIDAELFAAAMDGTTRPLSDIHGTVRPDAAATLGTCPAGALRAGEMLAFRWTASNGMAGGDCLPQGRYKTLDLRHPGLAISVTGTGGSVRARVRSEALALFVTLEADRPGRFSTNAITLFPGHDAEIDFTPDDGDPAGVNFTTRDLHSSFARAS